MNNFDTHQTFDSLHRPAVILYIGFLLSWPDENERNFWIHKIANLVPLTKRHNSEAQNYEFSLKKEKYFKGKSGTTSYALTTQVLNYQEWTPQIVSKRQEELLAAFKKGWD